MTIKEMREKTGFTQAKFGNYLNIPVANISKWEQGVTKPPVYVLSLIERVLKHEGYL